MPIYLAFFLSIIWVLYHTNICMLYVPFMPLQKYQN